MCLNQPKERQIFFITMLSAITQQRPIKSDLEAISTLLTLACSGACMDKHQSYLLGSLKPFKDVLKTQGVRNKGMRYKVLPLVETVVLSFTL